MGKNGFTNEMGIILCSILAFLFRLPLLWFIIIIS